MEKVLVIGPEYFKINNSIANAFEEKGYKTEVFDFSESYPVNIISKFTHGLLSKIGVKYYMGKYNTKVNEDIITTYDIFQPDIVIVVKGHKLFEDTLKHMSSSKLVLWMMDSVDRVPIIYNTIKFYDLVYVFEEKDIETLSERGIRSFHLPLALNAEIYKNSSDSSYKPIDIIFVGSLYQERIDILKKIIDVYPEKNIIIHGFFPSWKVNLKNISLRFSKYKKYFKIGSLTPFKVNDLYSKSKIVLNMHLNFSLSGCNLRFFEIAGTKSVQVVNKKNFIDKHFDMNQLEFSSYEELFDIIDNIFRGKIDTVAIADDVYRRVTTMHTYGNRINTILKQLKTEST